LTPGLSSLFANVAGYRPDAKVATAQRNALVSALSGKPAFSLNQNVTERYFRNAVVAPAMRAFDTDIAPRLAESFAGAGATYHSGLSQARAKTLADMQVSFGSELSRLMAQNQLTQAQLAESARARQLNAVPIASQASAQPIQNMGLLAQILGQEQAYKQAQAQAQYSEFLRLAPENNPYYKYLFQLAGLPNAYTPAKSPGWGQTLMGGLSTAMMAFSPVDRGGLGFLDFFSPSSSIDGTIAGLRGG